MALIGFSTKEGRREAIEEEDQEWHILTEEIFPRFSANELHTFKSVCKKWLRIISSPYFVGIHLKIHNKESTQIRVLIATNYTGDPEMIEYKINKTEIETKRIKIPYPPEIESIRRMANSSITILGSCDGLICFCWRSTVAMFNPSTGDCFWLQSPLEDYYSMRWSWFGRHPCSGEYVLVLGSFYSEIGVYKLSNKSQLQKIHSTCFPRDLYCVYEERVCTMLHGALHWPARRYQQRHDDRRHVICCYHLGDDKYCEIAPPLQRDFKLGDAEGCLFALCRAAAADARVFEMWIMKEYKVQQSWTKYVNIHTGGFPLSSLSPLGFFTNANLVSCPDTLEFGLVKYTFDDNNTMLFMDRDSGREAIMCADSLVSPIIVGT